MTTRRSSRSPAPSSGGKKRPSPARKSPPVKSPVAADSTAARTVLGASEAAAARVPSGRTYFDVYFYIPNLIGYARVALTAYAIVGLNRCTKSAPLADWAIPLLAYCLSFILDFFDGYAARHFNQSSNYGAVLDMVTDRVSTMLLLMVLGTYHPERFLLYAFLAALDYSSHWVQMYAAKGHHKTSNDDKNVIVRTFYGVYPFFAFCCAGTEFYYIARTALYFNSLDARLRDPLEIVTDTFLMLACFSKNVVNFAQLCSGFEAVAKRDVPPPSAKSS